MARSVLGRPLYWTGAYLVDGLLVDCGPPATARALLALIESLEAVGRLRLGRVFCAHRGPVPDGAGALRRKADRLRSLREQVQELLKRGLPEGEITRRVVGPEGPLTWISRGRFSARNFVRSVARETGVSRKRPEGPH